MKHVLNKKIDLNVSKITSFENTDLTDLCDATEATINDNANSFSIGFKRSEPLVRERLEKYWQGVLIVPERQLIVGRIDGVIAASVQLILPSPNNQTSDFVGAIEHHFVAPWARGFGIARQLLAAAEDEAKANDLAVIRLDVRADKESAIRLYESSHYKKWGTLDKYEKIDGKFYPGYFYYKDL